MSGEYRVELIANVWTKWVGEADSEEDAERQALNAADLEYEVDFNVSGIWGPGEDES